MDAVPILDHYRLSLVRNREYIQLLARLLRNGPQSTLEVAKSLDSTDVDVDRQLRPLYRAALVNQVEADLWDISDLGQKILDGLRITDLVSVDLAQDLAEAPSDRIFIKRWIERPSETTASRTRLSLLKFLTQARKLRHPSVSHETEDTRAMLYAVLIATDSWVQRAGVQNVSEVLQSAGPHFLGDYGPDSEQEVVDPDAVTKAWGTGMQRYLDSNRILLLMPNEPLPTTDEQTLELTWLRALDAALGGDADDGFVASCTHWRANEASVFWRFMLKRESIEQCTKMLYRRWAGLDVREPALLIPNLVEKLLDAVTKPTRTVDQTSSVRLALGGENEFDALVLMLRRSTNRLRHGAIQAVPNKTMPVLGVALREFEIALKAAGYRGLGIGDPDSIGEADPRGTDRGLG